MPSLVEGNDRQTVKRVVPKASNKIHAAGIAKLYIAHPDHKQWTYTGLKGAIVLANDLVGNTYWLKLVDVSPANRGVIWDQEIYDTFQYNQDRIFFHSFELEDCLAGLSFADDKEAKKFKQKVDEREKNAHKNTRNNPFNNSLLGSSAPQANGKSHSRLGGLGSLLHGHRNSSASQQPPPHTNVPAVDTRERASSSAGRSRGNTLGQVDPAMLDELLKLGVTEDQLAQNADFIKTYLESKTAKNAVQDPRPRAPISPQNTGSTTASKRGPPPALPPARRAQSRSDVPAPPSPERTPSPPRRRFVAPPPLANAGKFAEPDSPTGLGSPPAPPPPPSEPPSLPNRGAGPAPPPRPPKVPEDESDASSARFGVPPPFAGARTVPPPPTPGRSSVPPAPPPRDGSGPPAPPPRQPVIPPMQSTTPKKGLTGHAVPPAAVIPPPLPPKTPNEPATSAPKHIPPPFPGAGTVPPPPPPARNDPNASRAPPPPPGRSTAGQAPPPPPLPPTASKTGVPPPPPLPPPSSSVPPPPPLPPGMESATANAAKLPSAAPGRDGLLADIRGGARLKKVSASEKRDRSAAVVGGGSSADGGGGSIAPAPSGDVGGLAGALASALAARKSKVSASDDEDDKDDW